MPASLHRTNIKISQQEGAKLAFGGERSNVHAGFYLQPALFTETTNSMRITEEIFGPVASVIRVKDYDEALAVTNDTGFGLSSGICTSSLKFASDFKRNSEAGMVMVSLPTAGVDYRVPFGGRKVQLQRPRAGPLCVGILYNGKDRLYPACLTKREVRSVA